MAINNIFKSKGRIIHPMFTLIMLLFLFYNSSANDEIFLSVKSIEPGMTREQVIEIAGQPDSYERVQRWIFPLLGQVVIINERIVDIRLGKEWKDKTPIFGEKHHEDPQINNLRYLRVGNHTSNIEILAGLPEQIIEGEDWYYDNGKHRIEISEGKVLRSDTNIITGLEKLDWIRLNFSKTALLIMNITLAFIMFGVALEIKFDSFKQILKEPRSLFLGVFSQFLALPALTFLMIYLIKPTPSVALGMILVASCPGGNISNFMSSLAKGNIALSISLTAIATIFAVFMTPLNFAFWGKLYSETANLVIPIRIDFIEILRTVLILLGIPVTLGVWFARQFPILTAKIIKPLKRISMFIFIVFVIMALAGNFEYFKSYIHLIALLVFAHNALALLTGFSIGTLGQVSRADRRSLSIETGIQNSGLGLVLIFNPRLFDGLGGMAFIAAWWGIWHIISGLVIAYVWAKRPLPDEIHVKPIQQEADI